MYPYTNLDNYLDLTALARDSSGCVGREEPAATVQIDIPVPVPAPMTDAELTASLCNTYDIEYNSRPDATSITVPYVQVVTESPKAICLCVVDEEGELVDEWFPKVVCKNLTSDTIGVWEVFLKDAKKYLYYMHA